MRPRRCASVPVVNLPHVASGAMRLTGELLAKIFLGEVTQWNAPEIRALNPALNLPAERIRLVVRADGSGTTYHFSDYLSRVSPAWKERLGVASKFDWPGAVTAVKGSGEVSKAVRATVGSIGYVDYNYVLDDGLCAVAMRNADGQFVQAGVEGFRAAVAHSAWFTSGNFLAEINDSPGANTWPITMGTYVAVPRVAAPGSGTERAVRFITWAYLHGDALARQAKFVPLPDKVQASAYREIAKIAGAQGEPVGIKLLGQLLK
jgi:phosphate transport system substrate-binding protein